MPGRSAQAGRPVWPFRLAVPCFCLTFGRPAFRSLSLMAALELDRVSLAYGNFPAVRDFSLQIRAGDLVSLLGPSGSGKTTILRLIAGLERPESGTVLLRGKEMVSKRKFVPPEKRGIGFVFQDYALFPHLTVAGNIAFGLPAAGRRRAEPARTEAMLALVSLSSYAAHFPHQLSGGQQQRVALARALAPAPELILLDEPFSGLDMHTRSEVRDRTLHILQKSGTTCLLVTHDPLEAMYMSDKIALIREGHLIQYDRPRRLYSHPRDPLVAEFFGEINRLTLTARGQTLVSPFGTLPLPASKRGQATLELVIRPEALTLHTRPPRLETGRALAMRIDTVRSQGATSLVHLTGAWRRNHLHFHARCFSRNGLKSGDKVWLELSEGEYYLF